MINFSFLSNHSNGDFSFIFKNLEYVVIDELHYYRGVFGSHVANLIRRMKRICNYYGSKPRFFASSATIANPKELAENIFSEQFTHINNDGSPKADKEILFWVPPKISATDWKRPIEEAPELLPELVMRDYKFIAFSNSRRGLEVVLKETRERLKDSKDNQQNTFNFESLVAGYRGGYTPLERREIEYRLNTDQLKGVIATNALELGIDIGSIDVVVNMGFPYTKASFLQQIGRAGRKNKNSYAILILNMHSTIDQFVYFNPDWILNDSVENAIIDKNNLYIQTAHLRAAAAELPITMDDITNFRDLGEILPVLLEAKEIVNQNSRFVWNGEDFPAGKISLRGIDRNRYKVVNIENNEVLTEMDESTAFREVHPHAIYIHEGDSYFCERLDLQNRIADVKPTNDNYYTEPHTNIMITHLNTHK
jgi:DEAD/DEAH box helicase domain-containing protein